MSKPRAWYSGRIDPLHGHQHLMDGNWVQVEANQGWRAGQVLVTIDDEALIEYEMPNGSTALWVVKRDPPHQRVRSLSYYNVPLKWLRALVADGIEWTGNPQQQNPAKGAPLSAAAYLEKRTG